MMALKLESISKFYGTVGVLKDISLEITKGDFLVLLGASGCGKTTLLNCIAGLDQLSSGDIFINDRRVTDLEPSKRNVSMVFQSYALYPTMSVSRNISFGLECAGVPKKERNAAVARVAKLLQITELLNRKPSQLSGGQRQRVAIGRALVRNPEIFLLDEPMSNLDAQLRSQTRLELRELHSKLGATFVLVTHDQVEALSLATKIAVLDQGVVQQFGNPYEVYYFPKNLFVASFIGTPKMNLINGNLILQGGIPCFKFGDRVCKLSSYNISIQSPLEGMDVVFGIRPENIYRSKERLEGHDFLEIELRVVRSELTGGDVQVCFDLDGQQLISRFRSTQMPKNGAKVTLFMDMANISLFDKVTGLRI